MFQKKDYIISFKNGKEVIYEEELCLGGDSPHLHRGCNSGSDGADYDQLHGLGTGESVVLGRAKRQSRAYSLRVTVYGLQKEVPHLRDAAPLKYQNNVSNTNYYFIIDY